MASLTLDAGVDGATKGKKMGDEEAFTHSHNHYYVVHTTKTNSYTYVKEDQNIHKATGTPVLPIRDPSPTGSFREASN